jgi:hypothetical protein
MGIDIFGHIEVRERDNGDWQHVAKVDCSRDHNMFATLANVRNSCNIKHIIPKGIPNDVDYTTKRDVVGWKDAALYASWVSTEELEFAIKEAECYGGINVCVDYTALLAYMRAFEPEFESRFIFWFN